MSRQFDAASQSAKVVESTSTQTTTTSIGNDDKHNNNNNNNNSNNMPPKENPKKRKTSNERKNKEVRKSASREIQPYHAELNHRGHVKEVGDPTCYPCGSTIYQDGHYRSCEPCDAARFIMATWQREHTEQAKDNKVEPVPPLTLAGILTILKHLGATVEEVLSQPSDWNPYKPMVVFDSLRGKKIAQRKTFVGVFESFSKGNRARCLRPAVPKLEEWVVCDDNMEQHSHMLHLFNAKNELMEYIMVQAIKDGIISQAYVNKVASNFGAVPDPDNNDPNSEHEKLSDSVAYLSSDLYNHVQFEIPEGAEVGFERYPSAARYKMWRDAKADDPATGDFVLPHATKDDREQQDE